MISFHSLLDSIKTTPSFFYDMQYRLNRVVQYKPRPFTASEILFKRVVPIPGTNKFQYQDTRFKARCKAHNMQECYERIVDHLRSRQDVDPRSQFPSVKGKNFSCSYIGMLQGEA